MAFGSLMTSPSQQVYCHDYPNQAPDSAPAFPATDATPNFLQVAHLVMLRSGVDFVSDLG